MRILPFSRKILFLCCVSILSVQVVPVYAEEGLTKERIEILYERATQAQLRGMDEALKFYEEHTHQNYKTTLHIITNIQGAPTQKNTVDYDRQKMLEELKVGYKTSTLKTLEQKVIKFEREDDGSRAKVKNTGFSKFILRIPTEQGEMSFQAEQSMLCDDVVTLNDAGVEQVIESICNAEVNLEPVK